jgi:type VI protein secretion system component VasK
MDEGTPKQQMKRRVISNINLPSKLPINLTLILVIWYRLWPAESLWGRIVMWAIVGIVALFWAVSLINLATEQRVDVFKIQKITTKIADNDVYDEIIKRYKDKFNE